MDKQEATMTVSQVNEMLDKQRTEAHNKIIEFHESIKSFCSKQVSSAFIKSATIAYETKLWKYFESSNP